MISVNKDGAVLRGDQRELFYEFYLICKSMFKVPELEKMCEAVFKVEETEGATLGEYMDFFKDISSVYLKYIGKI